MRARARSYLFANPKVNPRPFEKNMTDDSLLFSYQSEIATLTLNRPQARNAITYAMWEEMPNVLREIEQHEQTRVLIVRGAGAQAFSSGGDISEFETRMSNAEQARVYRAASGAAMDALENFSKPTLALINGICTGGGLLLALAADMRVASDDARFGVPIARTLGMTLGNREMRRVVQTVGRAATLDLLLTARLVDANEALRAGLVSRVVPASEIETYTYHLAAEIAANAPLSHAAHKQILRTVLTNPSLANLSPANQDLPFACYATQDFAEARRAFLEKRKAEFKGK